MIVHDHLWIHLHNASVAEVNATLESLEMFYGFRLVLSHEEWHSGQNLVAWRAGGRDKYATEDGTKTVYKEVIVFLHI